MSSRAWRIWQWSLAAGAFVCLCIFIQLTGTRPTITYWMPDDEEKHITISCAQTSLGMGDPNEIPPWGGTSYYRVVEGEDHWDALRVIDGGQGVDTARLETDCLRASAHRQEQIIWTTTAGLLLIGASSVTGLWRRLADDR